MRSGLLAVLVCLLLALPAEVGAQPSPTPWEGVAAHDGIAYFLHGSGGIDRYDLSSQAWLPSLPTATGGTAMAVGAPGIFVGFGRRIARFPLAGGEEQHLLNTAGDVRELVLAGPLVAALNSAQGLISVDSATGAIIDAEPGFWAYYGLSGLSAAPARRRVFGRSVGLSPSDIVVETLAADGTFTGEFDSPYHGDYPSAQRTFVFPDQNRVADDAGIVYTTNALAYAGSLAGPLTDLAFHGGFPIVLRGSEVIAYDGALRELGRAPVPAGSLRIFVHDGSIFAFRPATPGIDVAVVPVSSLTTVVPGEPIDPTGLAYDIDGFAQGNDGTVYLLNRGNLSIFRWLPSTHSYGATIPLREAPKFMAYSGVTNRIYVAYPSGMITQIAVGASDVEEPFVTSPQSPCGLATAGEFLFVCDPSGAWESHFTYAPDGTLISAVEWNYFSREFIWSPERRRMYFFRDDTSPNDLIWEEIDAAGQIGAQQDSPYHGDFTYRHPIRLGPGGDVVLTGEGLLFHGDTLAYAASLANRIDDAVWLGNTVLTIRRRLPVPSFFEPEEPTWGVTEVQAWGAANYPLLWSRLLPGVPRRIFVDGSTPIVVTSNDGVPQWTVLTCGDGVVDPYEQCDGADLAQQSCAALGLGEGMLSCSDGCTFDAAACAAAPRCGDDVIDRSTEVCDGSDLGVIETCDAVGFTGGTLACSSDCTGYDTSGCDACGDGVVDFFAGEECDGTNLYFGSCESLGFPGGTLRCDAECQYDDSGCERGSCGDGVVEEGAGESCDDGNLTDCDGCSATCQMELCGNRVVECGEECDAGHAGGSNCLNCMFAPICSTGGPEACIPCAGVLDCDPAGRCGGTDCLHGICTPTPIDCTSDDPCEPGSCNALEGCRLVPVTGFDSVRCRLTDLEEVLAGHGVSAEARAKLGKLLGKAGGRIDSAETALADGKPKRVGKTLARARNTLVRFGDKVVRLQPKQITDPVVGAALSARSGDALGRIDTLRGGLDF